MAKVFRGAGRLAFNEKYAGVLGLRYARLLAQKPLKWSEKNANH
jgi:hypothetical protein